MNADFDAFTRTRLYRTGIIAIRGLACAVLVFAVTVPLQISGVRQEALIIPHLIAAALFIPSMIGVFALSFALAGFGVEEMRRYQDVTRHGLDATANPYDGHLLTRVLIDAGRLRRP